MKIFDTTLRDGTQSREVNLTVHDKLEILQLLDNAGINYVELGWPGSNPKDKECFEKAKEIKLNNAQVVAFCATRRKGVKAQEDPNLVAVKDAEVEVACIFGKTWQEHVHLQLKCTPKENLEAIEDSVKYLTTFTNKVFYDAEHFFDGYKDNKEYALDCITTAWNAGAKVIVLCDTNGGCLPDEILKIVKEVKHSAPELTLGIHCHNDAGCATANSLAAAELIEQVQGTINGVGERAGNADLCQVVPGLVLKKNINTTVKLDQLTHVSKQLYVLTNHKPNPHQPYVGKNAFSHKGGIHVDALSKGATYEHIKPELVGNKREIILSDLSGSANIVEMLKEFGIKKDKKDPAIKELLAAVKEKEKKGYALSELKAEKHLLINSVLKSKTEIELVEWQTSTAMKGKTEWSSCKLEGKIHGEKVESMAEVKEQGPVDAVYEALIKLIEKKYTAPDLKLTNYKVMIAEDKGAKSSVRVYVEFKNHVEEFATVGVSTNIIEASVEAIVKAFSYYISCYTEQKSRQ